MKKITAVNFTVNKDVPCDISIVVPAYNEQEVLPLFHRRLLASLKKLNTRWEIIYVDDGSTDNTVAILKQLHSVTENVGVLQLSRNFGKEQAMSAGLKQAKGNAVIIIDADLQDPPELIPSMVARWREGADVINMRRSSRQGESVFKRATAHCFYRVINKLSREEIATNVGDFRLFSRRVVDALNQLTESNRFMKGLFSWVGFDQVIMDYHRDPRAAGETKWNYWKLWNFALEGITSFTTAPLKVATYVGFLSAIFSFSYAFYFVFKTMFIGDTVNGFPTLIVTILMLGGLQLIAIGVVGEYLGRIFIESKNRPLFLIDAYMLPRRDLSSIKADSEQQILQEGGR
ncbi:MAG: glycosyltransferase family 2 protein [Spongiibacteraceae bacterium]